jgi:hypothetical protein
VIQDEESSMRDYWITTHWPTPPTDPGQSRHVFVKERKVAVPNPGDFVFFRQSVSATVNGRPVRKVVWHYQGPRGEYDVPSGSGGIIGTATVCGERRPIHPDDSVFDFGNLKDWSVIPCEDFQEAFLPLEDLLTILGRDGTIFLNLWRIPDESVALKLQEALRSYKRADSPTDRT